MQSQIQAKTYAWEKKQRKSDKITMNHMKLFRFKKNKHRKNKKMDTQKPEHTLKNNDIYTKKHKFKTYNHTQNHNNRHTLTTQTHILTHLHKQIKTYTHSQTNKQKIHKNTQQHTHLHTHKHK